MPDKARYWKNPEHHRQESNERQKKLRKLGFHGGYRNPATYLRMLKASIACHRKNRDVGRRSTRKYEAKVRAVMGGTGEWRKWLFKFERTNPKS